MTVRIAFAILTIEFNYHQNESTVSERNQLVVHHFVKCDHRITVKFLTEAGSQTVGI